MIFREIIGSCQDNCLSLHPVAVMKHPDKYSVRQKAFSPACSSRLQSFTAEALTAGAGENWSHCVLHQEHRTKMTRPCQFLAHFLTCFSVLVLWGRVSPPPPPALSPLLAALELSIKTRLAYKSQRFICLCLKCSDSRCAPPYLALPLCL